MTEPPSLAFFEAFTRYVDGSWSLERAAPVLVNSTASADRVQLYRRLIMNAYAGTLEALFPAVRVALEAIRAGAFREVVEGYASTRPSSHWDSNELGEGFSRFLSESHRPEIAAYAAEIADLQYLRHQVATREPFSETGLTLRSYSYAVLEFARAVTRGEAPVMPEPRPTLCLVGRSPRTGEVHMLTPTLAMVLVLASSLPEASIPDELTRRVTDPELRSARRALEELDLAPTRREKETQR